jgi:spermidine synthase
MKSLHTSLALLSATLIAFQILLMQIFSIVQWFHFATMVISVALLGFGASGTAISLSRDRLTRRAELLIPLFTILSGTAIPVAVWVSQLEGVRFDSYLLFVDATQIWALVLTYLVFMVPFFLGALALGIAFVRYVDQIGRLYFANLVGSGLGGLLAIGLLWTFPAQQAAAVVALLPISAGHLMLPSDRPARVILVALLGLAVVMTNYLFPVRLVPSQYKTLSRAMNLPDAHIALERTSPYGLVQVVSSSALRYAPGLSLTYRDPVPREHAVFNNGDAVGPIMRRSRYATAHVLDFTTAGLPYAAGTRERVLVLGASTGVDVAHALSNGARTVVAVEPHSVLVSIVQREYAGETDSLFQRADVHVTDPRAYLQADSSTYDLITLPAIGAFGGTTGLYALREQYLLTREAFREMWDRLTPSGVISVTLWLDHPPRSILRLHATIVEMLSGAGVDSPAAHIAAVRSWGTVTYMVKRTPITPDDTRSIRKFCSQRSFDPLLLPDLDSRERTRFNQMRNSSLFSYLDLISTKDRDSLYRAYEFDIRPTTDDRPYFSQFLRLGSLPRLREIFGTSALPFLEIGSMVVLVTLVQLLLMAVVLILLPLVRVVRLEHGKGWILLYFGAIGLGYMCLEIVLIQRCVLFLGHPLYAAAAVIGGMLMISGVGSFFSARLSATRKALWKVTALVALCILAYGFFLTPLLRESIGLSLGAKVFIAFLLIAVPAFVMGMPFPLGLRYLGTGSQARTAWAWGINGCFSVVSTSFALLIAVGAGFLILSICAAGFYGIAAMTSVMQR